MQTAVIHHLAAGLCDIYNKSVYLKKVGSDIFMFRLSKLPSYKPPWSQMLLTMFQGYGHSYPPLPKWYNDERRARFYDPLKAFENYTH